MQNRKPYVTTKHFQIHLFDKEGLEVGKEKERIYSVEYTEYQDTVDLIPYFIQGGKLYVVVIESLKPTLLLRPQVVKPIDGIYESEHNGYLVEQPSAVIQHKKNEYGIADTIRRIFAEKIPGLVSTKETIILGGSYFPSVGSSTEIVFPRGVEIAENSTYSHVSNTAYAYVMEAQDVIDLYFKQEKPVSTRLIELVFRLAEKLGHNLTISSEEPAVVDYKREDVLHSERFVDSTSLRTILEEEIPEGSSLSGITIEDVEKPKVPFLLTTHFRAEGTKTDGGKEQIEVDVLLRKKVDSIDVGGYFIVDSKLYMPIKWGIRPTLAVRNLMPHPIHTDASPYFIEGIAGSLEGEITKEDLLKRGITEAVEEVSLPHADAPLYIGYDYPSPGHNPERAYRALLPLDPTKEVKKTQNEEETARVVYASIEDIIQLAHEGVIRDPRLSLNAHLLKSMYQETPYAVPTFETTQEDALFESLVNKTSEVQQWLSKTSKTVDEILSESSLYRKLKTYGENELGVAVMTLTHDKEAHFFSPMVPLFATPSTQQENKLPFYYLHDLFHYSTAGFIPLLRKGDRTEICSFEEYMRAITGNECEAVWYSDVLIPEEFGVDRAEQIFNGDSVARAFAELGIEKEEAREIIRTIELHGKIPEYVRLHPLFGRFRGVFVGRLLRYHVMDTDNTKSMYEYWRDNLDIAEVMEDFCDVFSSVEEYEKYYKETVARIMNYTEGVNPLRAYLSKLLNVELRLLALKFAYIRHEAEVSGLYELEKNISSLLGKMKASYREIRENRTLLSSIDPTQLHKKIILHAHGVEQGIVKEAKKYIESLENDPSIPEEVRKNIRERTVPFFEPFRDIDPTFLKEELARLEKENNL